MGSTGALDLSSLFPPNYSAQEQASWYTRLTKEYKHTSPKFVVRYPGVYDPDKPMDEAQVFQARSRNGRVPVLTVSVTPATEGLSLSQVAGDKYAPRLRKIGNQVQIISNTPVKLAGGIDAYETRFKWRLPEVARFNSVVISTLKDGSLINVGLHNIGEVDYLKHIPYSLSFE